MPPTLLVAVSASESWDEKEHVSEHSSKLASSSVRHARQSKSARPCMIHTRTGCML